MPEKEAATGGQPMAGGLSGAGNHTHSQYSTSVNGAASAQGASVPFMLTQRHRQQLRALGYAEEQINAMTPSQAHTLLGEQAASSNGAGGDALLAELDALAEQASVEPADVLSATKVQALVAQVADYTGDARQAVLEALRALIGHLPTEERQRLDLYPLFAPPDQHKQIESFLASCPAPAGVPIFHPLTFVDLLGRPPKEWLLEEVFGAGDIGMIYGPPGSGKTFIVIDLCMAACLGRLWAMRFTVARPLAIAYCAGEGLGGLPQRFAAAAQHHGIEDLANFTFFESAPQLFTPERDAGSATAETIGRFVREWQQRQQNGQASELDLLIVDTLHSATAGADENSAQDMGQVLQAVKAASKALGCAVLLVHHTNKAGTGERGSSAMRGALDFMIEVKPTAGKFAMECAKLKDSAAWKPQTFDLIELGGSARVWWDEPGELDGKAGKQAQDIEAILAVLRGSPSTRYTAALLAETIGMGGSKQIFRLLPKAMKADASIRSGLKYADRDGGPHNPQMYWWQPEDPIQSPDSH